MNTVHIYGSDRELNAVRPLLDRQTISAERVYQFSGVDISCHVYPATDLVNDVNLVAALSHLYPLMLYRFYNSFALPMKDDRKGIDSDDYTNYNTKRNWNLTDILALNFAFGYNVYPMDIRTNLVAAYHNLASTTLYKAMADEVNIIEEAIPRISAQAPSEEEYPVLYARKWLIERRHNFLEQGADKERQQRIAVISAVVTMIDEHVKGSKGEQ